MKHLFAGELSSCLFFFPCCQEWVGLFQKLSFPENLDQAIILAFNLTYVFIVNSL